MEILRVGAAIPNPPFNGAAEDSGLDVELMTEIGRVIGATVEFVEYRGADWAGILDELAAGSYDCVASGFVVPPENEQPKTVAFAPPYLISGQALAVDNRRQPQLTSVADLAGHTIWALRGSSGHRFAQRLVADGAAERVRTYDCGELSATLADLGDGGCDAVLALAPVLNAAVAGTGGGLEVVQRQLSTDEVAVAVRSEDQPLLSRITVAQSELEDDGTLQRIRRRWLGNPYTDQNLAAH